MHLHYSQKDKEIIHETINRNGMFVGNLMYNFVRFIHLHDNKN